MRVGVKLWITRCNS